MFEIIGKALFAVASSGAIVVAVSSFIAKFWSEKYMLKKTKEYEREISQELENLKMINKQLEHRGNIVFDYEFKMIQEITTKLYFTHRTFFKYLASVMNDQLDFDEEGKLLTIEGVRKVLSEYTDVVDAYAAFVDKELYISLGEHVHKLEFIYFEIKKSSSDDYAAENLLDNLNEATDKVIDCIRIHIKGAAK